MYIGMSMNVWELKYDVWEYGCMGIWMYENMYVGIWMYGNMGISSHPFPPPLCQPENLLLASKEPGSSVKLADFGLAVEAMDGKNYYGDLPSLSLSLSLSLVFLHSPFHVLLLSFISSLYLSLYPSTVHILYSTAVHI